MLAGVLMLVTLSALCAPDDVVVQVVQGHKGARLAEATRQKMIALLTTLSLAWEPKIAEMPEADRLEQFALEEKLITLASEKEAAGRRSPR